MLFRSVVGCCTIAADLQCKLDSELFDGVQTWINGVSTGLKPLPQTRILGGPACPADLTRDFFLKDRTYRCNVDDIAKPDTSRGAYIIDHSTETLLADRTLQSDGSYTSSTRAFSLPDRGRSEEHTSELQSLMRISYAVFCLKKKKT